MSRLSILAGAKFRRPAPTNETELEQWYERTKSKPEIQTELGRYKRYIRRKSDVKMYPGISIFESPLSPEEYDNFPYNSFMGTPIPSEEFFFESHIPYEGFFRRNAFNYDCRVNHLLDTANGKGKYVGTTGDIFVNHKTGVSLYFHSAGRLSLIRTSPDRERVSNASVEYTIPANTTVVIPDPIMKKYKYSTNRAIVYIEPL